MPEAPETYYLMELLASHDFQTGLQNYLDLADLRRKLVTWQGGFDAYDEMVTIRRDHYDPLLPEIDTEFRELDSRMRLRNEQHKMLIKRRDDLLTTPRPEFLATPEEQDILAIDSISSGNRRRPWNRTVPNGARIRRLKGRAGLAVSKPNTTNV